MPTDSLQHIERNSEAEYRRIAAANIRGLPDTDADLATAQEAVRREIERQVESYSALDWLLYVRNRELRELTVWLNDGMETAHHVEFLTSLSANENVNSAIRSEGLDSQIDAARKKRAAQLIGGAFVYRQLLVFRRLLTFDINLALRAGEFPEQTPSPEQQRNLKAYGRRSWAQPMLIVTGSGVALTPGQGDSEDTTFVCVGYHEIPKRFFIGPIGIKELQSLITQGMIGDRWIPLIGDILLELKLAYLLASRAGGIPGIEEHGLFCTTREVLESFFGMPDHPVVMALTEALPGWRFDGSANIIERLRNAGKDIGFSPPVRVSGNLAALDLHSASLLLNEVLFRSFQKRAGERGAAFEMAIQHAIDESAWRPPDSIRAWRNRTLTNADGRALTDIDALGVKGDTLLLVEAKAIHYSAGYGTSTRSEVRNARDTCEIAVRKCTNATLASATNLDLSQFRKIIRVVCTPAPIYCNADYMEVDGEGFSPTMSFIELLRRIGAFPAG